MTAFEKMSTALLFVTLGSLLGKFVIGPLWQRRKAMVALGRGGVPYNQADVSEAPLAPALAAPVTEQNFVQRAKALGLLPDDEFERTDANARNATDRTVIVA